MPRRRRSKIDDSIKLLIWLLTFFIIGLTFKLKEIVERHGAIFFVGFILIVATGIALIIYFSYQRKRSALAIGDDKKIMYMLKGMNPEEFEQEIANMFNRYGYKAKAVGMSHDHGIDVIAKRDGQTYLVQCKKYMTNKVGVVDVRSFYGVINLRKAAGGFFITTNEFTNEAQEEFKRDKKIKLIDKTELVKFYRKSL